MKVLFWILLSSSSFISFSQDLDCNSIKKGKFINKSNGYHIDRKSNKDIVEIPEYGVILELKIEWIDSCTFKTIYHRTIKYNRRYKPAYWNRRIEIIEISNDSFKTKQTIEGEDKVYFVEYEIQR